LVGEITVLTPFGTEVDVPAEIELRTDFETGGVVIIAEGAVVADGHSQSVC
jgi:hypothetical protein